MNYGQRRRPDSGDKPTGSLVTNFSTVVKQFVVDYTSPTFEPLMEHEVNGLDYRYVYGNDRLSVNITGVETSSGNLIENRNQIRLYYHMDYLGTTDYLTSPVSLKVTSWTHYNEWGEITHNAVLKSGKRELDLVKRYATHDYDAVLGMYYAKARFYDAENRRFASMDPVKGEITNPLTMVQYVYAIDCPLVYIDVAGERAVSVCVSDGGGSTKSTSVKAKASTTAPLSGMVGGALAGLRANITPKVPVPQAPKAVTPKKAANPRRTATASSVVKAAAASAIIGTQKKAPQAPKAKARVLSTHDKAMPPRQYNTPLSCEEFNPYYDSIGDWGAHLWDDIKDAGNEVAGLGKTIWDNQGYWFDRVLNPNDTFDWIYSSANWWTLGTIDSFVRANDARWKAMLSDPSLYTITNYFTLGTTETLGRAISPGSYGVKFFSLEHIISFGSVIAAGYTAGKGYQATHIDPHSTAGLQQISGLPENVVISQGAMDDINIQGIPEYTPPAGGGGITTSICVGNKTITFGHGGRHAMADGFNYKTFETAIAHDVVTKNLTPQLYQMFDININGTMVRYGAFLRDNGVINVGTYYVK